MYETINGHYLAKYCPLEDEEFLGSANNYRTLETARGCSALLEVSSGPMRGKTTKRK